MEDRWINGYLEQGAGAAVPHDAARPAGVRPDPHLGVRLLRLDGVLSISEAFQLGHYAVGTLLAPRILLQGGKASGGGGVLLVVGHRGLTLDYRRTWALSAREVLKTLRILLCCTTRSSLSYLHKML